MSILTEVNRIKNAVSAIAQAIRGKGVTVPTTAKVGDLATYISSIKTGADIKTCTVNVKFSIKPSNGFVGATTFADGTMSRFSSRQGTTGTITIPNVVCGSALFIDVGTYASLYGWSYGYEFNGASISFVLNVPSAAGTYTAEIGVLDD